MSLATKLHLIRHGLCAILFFAPLGVVQAGTVHGTVQNGTTGKPGAGVQVILIQLQGGMQPVANTQADAQGHFTFDNPVLGTRPMLVRAVYRGINFHQPLPPGKSDVEISVFDPSKDPKIIGIPSRIVFFQPNGSTLIVGEEYSVENNSKPPQTYFRADGNFDFALPPKAQIQQVAAAGPAGMPVVQATIDKGDNRFAIAYAFRPGQSTVRYSYELPYAGNAAIVTIPSPYTVQRLLVVAPPTMQISGEGLQAGGQEQGMSIYGRENVAANTTLAISVSGTAPPPSSATNSDQGPQQSTSQESSGRASEMPPQGDSVQQVPGRLDVLKWPLIAGFIALVALGAILLARKPLAITSAPASYSNPPAVKAAPLVTPQANIPTVTNLSDVDALVGTSLDSLKERLFRLELRHQAGTISDEDYAQERTRAEKLLRDLVRG
jgi:hypothetical protein